MPSPGEPEPILLGGPRRYTCAQVAEAAGVPLEHAQRLWLALGFAEVGDEAAVFTDGDVEALRVVEGLVRSAVLEPGMDRTVARQLGQTFSRAAPPSTGVRGRSAPCRLGGPRPVVPRYGFDGVLADGTELELAEPSSANGDCAHRHGPVLPVPRSDGHPGPRSAVGDGRAHEVPFRGESRF